jgi:hypothetical protein
MVGLSVVRYSLIDDAKLNGINANKMQKVVKLLKSSNKVEIR